MPVKTGAGARRGQLVRRSLAAMTGRERARVMAMYGVILGLHVAGFVIFLAFVVPSHYQGLGIGVSVLAYTLGLRHAFDADHISAIDNTPRKVIGDRQGTGAPRPFGCGFFFSLGHCTVVVAIGAGIILAEKTVLPAVAGTGTGLQRFGGLAGIIVSASFLFMIGLLNLVILAGIVRIFAAMRRGEYDEAELERQLAARGFFSRFFGRWMRAITAEWQLYPVGVLFGLGFDTATEVGLLASTALLASQHIPWYAIICLPVLFTAGMTLMDTTDGLVMNLAYGWALFNPVRKVYYNLAITGLSVAMRSSACSPGRSTGSAAPGASGPSWTTSTSTPPGSSSPGCSSPPGWPPCSSGGSAASSRNGPSACRPPGPAAPRHRQLRSRPACRVSKPSGREPSGREPSGREPSGREPSGRGPRVGLAEVAQGLAQLPA